MTKTLTILSGLLLILYSCNQPSHANVAESKTIDTVDKQNHLEIKKPKVYNDKYIFSKDTITETLFVSKVSKKTIDFMWVLEKGNFNRSDTIQGLAMDKTVGQDYETDEDEEGNGYLAEDFIYKQVGCDMHIRISVDKDIRRAQIKSADCKTKRGKAIETGNSLLLTK